MRIALTLALLCAAAPVLAFDLNGVGLGASELEVRKKFPGAYCKPLEWKTDAADRRCDDVRAAFAGIPSRLTFYLRGDKVQGFDLRFDGKDLEQVKALLKSRWGAPRLEAVETIARREAADRKVLKMRWEKGADHATLVHQLDGKRVGVEVARGAFFDDIYKVK